MRPSLWRTTRFQIDLTMPKVMGIVNVTPDSFSDGGRYFHARHAIDHCERLVNEGAHIVDIGAESSRPGAIALPQDEEIRRLVPVLVEALKLGVPIAVDTYKPAVMQVALDLGVDILNDIWGFRQMGHHPQLSAAQVVAASGACGLCVMHMHGEPQSMQLSPMQGDVVEQVVDFLRDQTSQLVQMGIDAQRIVVDPGIGFGKTVAQNFSLLGQQRGLLALGYPLLVGWSRKSSLAAATGMQAQEDRLIPSIAAAVLAVERGAKIVRVHDVAATLAALKIGMQ